MLLAVGLFLLWLYVIRPIVRKASTGCELDAIEDLAEVAEKAERLNRDPNTSLADQVERDAYTVRKAREAARKAGETLE